MQLLSKWAPQGRIVPIYRVLIHGTEFVMRFEDGAMERKGFYVNRHVRSDSPGAASETALDLVRSDPRLLDQLSVRLSVEEVAQTGDESPPGVQPGFIFYDASASPT